MTSRGKRMVEMVPIQTRKRSTNMKEKVEETNPLLKKLDMVMQEVNIRIKYFRL